MPKIFLLVSSRSRNALTPPPPFALGDAANQATENLLTTVTCTWWSHQMEIFSALLALCVGNSLVTEEFPSHRRVTRSFDIFFDLRRNELINAWVKNREAGDLRRHHAHNDVILMCIGHYTSKPETLDIAPKCEINIYIIFPVPLFIIKALSYCHFSITKFMLYVTGLNTRWLAILHFILYCVWF